MAALTAFSTTALSVLCLQGQAHEERHSLPTPSGTPVPAPHAAAWHDRAPRAVVPLHIVVTEHLVRVAGGSHRIFAVDVGEKVQDSARRCAHPHTPHGHA